MKPLSNSDFLDLWERGNGMHALDQGLLVLGAALPETSYDRLADWSLGRRNRALIELRSQCFGPHLQGWTCCTRCEEKLEIEVNARSLASEPGGAEESPCDPIIVNGHCFRLPTSRDLARAAQETDPLSATLLLIEGCRVDTGEIPAWTGEELEIVGERMALADPMAELPLTLRCPACNNEWIATLDIATFFWTEIEARAKRILFEIHALASQYGWTEKEILSLSEQRRALYMGMVHE
ncbi:MAG: hypothetical protein ABSD75_27725 [Terriglobales bacterium]|jgi:hypothetical protein